MNVQVLYFVGCPNHAPAVDLAREIIAELRLDVDVQELEVTSADDLAGLRFLGSPTIQINGIDVDPEADGRTDFGFGCRTYDGAGVPPRELLVAALKSAAAAPDPSGRTASWAARGAARGAMGGSVVSAVLASACCWVPLLMLGFGVSAVGVSATFARTRPLFLAAAVVGLATGFYLNYFRNAAPAACSGCAAPGRNLRRFNRAVLWGSALIVAVAAFFPKYIGLLIGDKTPAVAAQTAGASQTVAILIEGMTCEGCATVVKSALAGVPGVRTASVSYAEGHALVAVDPVSPPAGDALVNAVEKAGFRADLADPDWQRRSTEPH